MAAKLNLRIRQMDAVTAFLNGKLEEDVYMKQPEGCDDRTKRVCKLKRSLYGLKQSSRVWNERLNESLLHFGLVRSEIDQCVYFFPSEKKTLIVAIYVDDVLILSNDSVMEDKLKSNLCHNFRMKDLGDASSILGIRITRNNDHSTISLDQKHYLLDVLKRFNMLDCNPISTPLDPNQKLTKSQCPTETADIEEMSQKPYMQAVGSLLFAAQLTRPDIAYAVNMLSRFGTNPGKAHWAAVKRVLRYVKGTIDKRLTYQKEHSEVEGYCDADHAGNLDTAQTTTGYVFLLQGGAVSWASKLQKRITLSTTESEFVAMVAASKEATWLKGLQREIFPATPKLTILYCDNKGAENKANNNSYSDATKHVLIKLKYLHQRIKDKELKLVHVSSDEMIADALTKGLPKIKLEYFSKKFGLN